MSSNAEDEDPPTQRPPAQISDDEFWLVSYAEDDDRELTTKEIVAAMKRGEITLSTLIWRDGMGEWQTIASIDELRTRAGFIVQPFLTDAPPRPAGESLRAIAALAEDIEEIPSSAIQSAPPSSLAEADFLGNDEGDNSLAPPLIDHAAFFKSSPPPESDKKTAALPALPTLGGKTAAASAPSAATSGKSTQKKQGGSGLKWVLVVFTALGAATAGFLLTPVKKSAPPPQPAAMGPAERIISPKNNGKESPSAEPPGAVAAAAATAETEVSAAAEPAAPAQDPALAKPNTIAVAPNPAAASPAAAVTAKPATPSTTATAPAAAPATATPTPPASPPPPPRVTSTAPFDKAAASTALGQAAAKASSCRQPGDPSGTAQVEVTFSPSGRATRAIIGGPPFRGTATGSCIAQTMRSAQVPAFAGDLVTVQKRVVIQ